MKAAGSASKILQTRKSHLIFVKTCKSLRHVTDGNKALEYNVEHQQKFAGIVKESHYCSPVIIVYRNEALGPL